MSQEMNYCLYRSLYDIIHPSISRENISDYRIVIQDYLVPLQIFYPNKNVILEKIIIYIPDQITDFNVYKELAKKTDTLVLLIDSKDKKNHSEYYDMINYIYNHIEVTGIHKNNIVIMSDCDGERMEKVIHKASVTNDFIINKSILLNPIIQQKEFSVGKNSLIIVGEEYKDIKNKNYTYIKHYLNDFIEGNNIATKEHVYSIINQFIS